MKNDHFYLFSPRDTKSLRPGEKYAFENAEEYGVRLFLGHGKYTEMRRYPTLKIALGYVSQLEDIDARPMVYALSKRKTGDIVEECMVFLPINFQKNAGV